MKLRAALASLILLLAALAAPAFALTPRYSVQIVKTYPHDPAAFTEGLFYLNGDLYESTGRNGQSWIRQVDLVTGKPLRQISIDKRYFGEGIAPWKGSIVSLTWQAGTGFVWSQSSLKQLRSFRYTGEGWGMTADAHNLIMSDGTATIRFLDPVTLRTARTITVTLDGQPLDQINELEWVKGELIANVWRTRQLVRIDPKTGHVTGIVDLFNLPEIASPPPDPDAVANGIAYDPVRDRLFVTGKLWPHLYEVRFTPE
jgi:glutaminyl-peptide cyclotransferase